MTGAACYLPGRAKDLSAPRYTIITCVVCWFRIGKDEGNTWIQKGCKVIAYWKAIYSVYFALEISANDIIIADFTRSMCSYFIWVNKDNSLKKVKWSRYRPGVPQRVGRGIALLFHDRSTRRRWVVSSTPRPLFVPRKDPVPFFAGGWVGLRAGLDGRKISAPPEFDPGPPSPKDNPYSNRIITMKLEFRCIHL